MKKREIKSLTTQEWQQALVRKSDAGFYTDHSFDVPYWVMEIHYCAQQILATKSPIFLKNDKSLSRHAKQWKLRERVLRCICAEWHLICETYPRHRFSPYVEIFGECVARTGVHLYGCGFGPDQEYIDFIAVFRAEAESRKISLIAGSKWREIENNISVLLIYIDKIFNYYRKLAVIRLDLKFSEEFVQSLPSKRIPREYAQARFAAFLKKLHKISPGLVGYIRKIEHDAVEQYYFRVFLFLDARKTEDDVLAAELAGAAWVKTTKGNGLFRNYNLDRKLGHPLETADIGLVKYWRGPELPELELAVKKLVLLDEFVRLNLSAKTKAITHGVFQSPKPHKEQFKKSLDRRAKWLARKSRKKLAH